jgi:hypothetical protein
MSSASPFTCQTWPGAVSVGALGGRACEKRDQCFASFVVWFSATTERKRLVVVGVLEGDDGVVVVGGDSTGVQSVMGLLVARSSLRVQDVPSARVANSRPLRTVRVMMVLSGSGMMLMVGCCWRRNFWFVSGVWHVSL